MTASALSGPLFVYGNTDQLLAAQFGSPVPDPNSDAGPSGFYKGTSVLDVRYVFLKDKVTGYAGVVASHYSEPLLRSVGAVPAALSASNIAAAANVTNGTKMTLVAASSVGVAINMPYRVFANTVNGGAVATAAVCLDFGFAFGNCTAASGVITVADRTLFDTGMPLVIDAVGNSAGTAPLLTQVTAVSTSAQTITVSPVPLATNSAAAIGTGDLWGPSPIGYPLPQAHAPLIKGGSGLLLDARQTLMRGVVITGVAGGAGGTFLVQGADIYGAPLSQLITVGAGAVAGYSLKTFKYVFSVTPQFTDAHNYSVGTSDVFGFAYRANFFDDLRLFYASAAVTTNVSANNGFVAADATNPATTATGDIHGTLQVSSAGGGNNISGGAATNGVVTSLVMTGRRLTMEQFVPAAQMILATQSNPAWLYGQTDV